MADDSLTNDPKRLRSLPPDVTVIVGSGDTAKSFSCYKLALCFASPYFDTMLSAGMREDATNTIELPDKDPEEWKEFYKIIDPSQIGEVRSGSCIDETNAVKLTAWFHEFSMVKHLKECDDVLAEKVEDISNWHDKNRGRLTGSAWKSCNVRSRENFAELIDLLEHAGTYDLLRTVQEVELTIGSMLKNHLQDCQGLFDIGVIGRLVRLCLPVARNNFRLLSTGMCSNLWDKHLSPYLAPQRSQITADMVNTNEMFPLLLHSYMQQAALKLARVPEHHRASRGSALSRMGSSRESRGGMRPLEREANHQRRPRDLFFSSDSSSVGSIIIPHGNILHVRNNVDSSSSSSSSSGSDSDISLNGAAALQRDEEESNSSDIDLSDSD
jgi:hypothetical protein